MKETSALAWTDERIAQNCNIRNISSQIRVGKKTISLSLSRPLSTVRLASRPLEANMASTFTFFWLVLQATVVSGGKQLTFVMHVDQEMIAVTPVQTSTVSKPLTCHAQCLRRQDCVALTISGSSCSLFDTYVTQPENQLQNQQGTILYSQCKLFNGRELFMSDKFDEMK